MRENAAFSPLLIDVHNHAWLFNPDWEEEYREAQRERIGVIATALDVHTAQQLLSLSLPVNVRVAIGIYPPSSLHVDVEHGLLSAYNASLRDLKGLLADTRIVGMGEIGLDGKHGVTEEDEAMFTAQLRMAEEHGLPGIIHSRRAEERVIEILEAEKPGIPIVLHSFTGRLSLAKRAVTLGNVFFSIPCSVQRSTHFQRLAEVLPEHALLLETDAPFLSPTPGGKSRAVCIRDTLRIMARMRGVDEEALRHAILENTFKAFPRLAAWKTV